MPIYGAVCVNGSCMKEHDFFRKSSELDTLKEELERGEWLCSSCGDSLEKSVDIPNQHSVGSGYPFQTAPWMLPPKIDANGRAVPDIRYIQNRGDLKRVHKEFGLTDIETDCDKLTMYSDGPAKAQADSRRAAARADSEMFSKLMNNEPMRRSTLRGLVDSGALPKEIAK